MKHINALYRNKIMSVNVHEVINIGNTIATKKVLTDKRTSINMVAYNANQGLKFRNAKILVIPHLMRNLFKKIAGQARNDGALKPTLD